MIDHFSIEHNKQHIKIYVWQQKDLSDSIVVDMQDVDVKLCIEFGKFSFCRLLKAIQQAKLLSNLFFTILSYMQI